jgi:hypothetical protein
MKKVIILSALMELLLGACDKAVECEAVGTCSIELQEGNGEEIRF